MRHSILKDVFAAILLVLSSVVSSDDLLLDKEDFGREFYRLLSEQIDWLDCRLVDELTLECTLNSDRFVLHLDESFQQYRHRPEDLDSIMYRLIQSIHETSRMLRDTIRNAYNVIPLVRGWQLVNEFREQGGSPVFDSINSELVILYAFDNEYSLRHMHADDLKDLGLSRVDVRYRALKNLRAVFDSMWLDYEGTELSGTPPLILHSSDSVVQMHLAGGDFESSILLLPEYWKDMSKKYAGDMLMVVPHKDVVFSADGSIPGALNRLSNVVESQECTVSDKIFIRVDRKWQIHRDE